MNLRAFLILTAVLAIAYALGFLIVPKFVTGVYGVSEEPAVILGYRFFGAALLAIGLIFWLAKDYQDRTAIRALLVAGVASNAAGAASSIWGSATGIMNGLGWTVVLIHGREYLHPSTAAGPVTPAPGCRVEGLSPLVGIRSSLSSSREGQAEN